MHDIFKGIVDKIQNKSFEVFCKFLQQKMLMRLLKDSSNKLFMKFRKTIIWDLPNDLRKICPKLLLREYQRN